MTSVLITGATGGIGREFARSFGSRGFDLVLVGRNGDTLEELKGELLKEYAIDVAVVAADLSKENGPEEVYEACHRLGISVAVLVNNAGFGDYGPFIDSDLGKQRTMIDLNCKSLVSLTYLFLQDMKENGYGRIINVGSIASFMPGPQMSVYYATKSFVLSFSMALREELKDTGISVTTLCPGPTRTGFAKQAQATEAQVFSRLVTRDPQSVAEYGYKLFAEDKAYGVEGFFNKAGALISRHLPLSLSTRIVGLVQSMTRKKG
ncbi:MAG: SDR family oxidoreductase [Erysipelotrichaceae bacterium]|nr:SDR family oxidoreductase [Erysipelotrichaceae bacterium]